MTDSNQSSKLLRLNYIESVLSNYVGKIVNIRHIQQDEWQQATYIGKKFYCNNLVNVFLWKEPTTGNLEQILGYKPLLDKDFTIDEQEEGLYVTFRSHCYWTGIREDSTCPEDKELFDKYAKLLLEN